MKLPERSVFPGVHDTSERLRDYCPGAPFGLMCRGGCVACRSHPCPLCRKFMATHTVRTKGGKR